MFPDDPLLMVDDNEGVVALAKRLSTATVIGVDTEADSMYHYQEKVCLIQFTDSHGDVIVDPLKANDLSPLKPIFADRGIVKVYHGADYDVISLRRDFGFDTKNLFDTLFAAQFLNFPKLGLADLIDRFFGYKPDKQYQRHDWSRRPLYPEHLDYARGDTHYLLALHEILRRKLKSAGRLRHHREECRLIEKRVWTGRSFDPDGYVRIKRTGHLSDEELRILRRLYLHRDKVARDLDRPTYKVLSDKILIEVAEEKPTTRGELDDLYPRKAAMKRRHGSEMVKAVVKGMGDDFDIPSASADKKKSTKDPKARLHGRAAERVFEALKSWRNKLCARDETRSPFSVASNTVLKRIAARAPESLEDLQDVPDVRKWQVRDLGEDILAVVAKAVPTPEELDALSKEGDSSKRSRRRRRR